MNLYEAIQTAIDDHWLDLLRRSVTSREVDGLVLPGFPPDEHQKATIGSSGANALLEADRFYRGVKALRQDARARGQGVVASTRFRGADGAASFGFSRKTC